jgi:hypothetical protein
MTWLPTPNYILIRDWQIPSPSWHDQGITLAALSFVRPIDASYVPKHILEDSRWKRFDPIRETFCFTRYGIVPIEWEAMRQV